MADFWVTEAMNGFGMTVQVTEELYSKRSEFQKIDVYQTSKLGRMLLLDGIIQLTEFDEFAYHEMLAHIPLFAHENPKRLLVVGGGDGGVDAVDRIDLETEMVDRIRAGFGRFALKEFEIIAVAGLQVEADRFVVAPEVERFFEPEPLAVETGGPAEIGYTDAEMGNPFDHDADSFSVFVDWC